MCERVQKNLSFTLEIALKEISHNKGKVVFWVVVFLKIDSLKHVFLEIVQMRVAWWGRGGSLQLWGGARGGGHERCPIQMALCFLSWPQFLVAGWFLFGGICASELFEESTSGLCGSGRLVYLERLR